jgi:hypothetical protein
VNWYQSIIDGSTLFFADVSGKVKNEFESQVAKKAKDYHKMKEKIKESQEVYLKLKNYFKKAGQYEKSGQYYYREMVMSRKLNWINKKNEFFKWLGNWFYCLLCGYGEKISRILVTAFFTILISSLFFYFTKGIMYGVNISYNPTYWESLFFSVVTFTTLGYGDYRPKPDFTYQSIASIEAFIGVFILALFAFVIARRIMR